MHARLMLAFELVGVIIILLLMILRFLAGHRKRFRPYNLEIFGCCSYIASGVLAIIVMVHCVRDGFRMMKWMDQGYSEREIRDMLLSVEDFKLIYVGLPLSTTAVWCGKASFLAAYGGTFGQHSKALNRLFVVTVMYATVAYLMTMSIYLFYCWPINRNWAIRQKDFCSSVLEQVPLVASIVLNITTDLLLLSIPFYLLLQVRKTIDSRTEKYGVALITILATTSIAVSVYRVVDTQVSDITKGEPLTLAKRNSYIFQENVMLVTVLMAYCIPSLRVLMRNRGRSGRGESAIPLTKPGALVRVTTKASDSEPLDLEGGKFR